MICILKVIIIMTHVIRCTECKKIEKDNKTQNCQQCGGILECVYSKEALRTLKEKRKESRKRKEEK